MSNEPAHVASAITRKLDRLDENHRRVALDALAELKRLDTETSKLALKIFRNREDAALWLAAKIPSLIADFCRFWVRPYFALAQSNARVLLVVENQCCSERIDTVFEHNPAVA